MLTDNKNKMNQILKDQYKQMGLCEEVITFGDKIEATLKERFLALDQMAELNQMKVLHAMQKNKVSAVNLQYLYTGG